MRGTMWLMALGCGLLLSSSGCCGYLQNGGCGRGCGCESCGTCEGECGAVRRPVRQRVCADDCGGCDTCGTCGTRRAPRCSSGGCGECGDGCDDCCQRNFCFHPLKALGRLFCVDTWCGPSCGSSCRGESACGCETCGQGGRMTGHAGCSSCNHGGGGYEGGEMSPAMEGQPMESEPAMQPTLAPSKATRRAPPANYDR